ncbi:MAG: DNA polymerase III subunit chi [Gammaproteobacteria bacterium]
MSSPELRVDFYVLQAADAGARMQFACRLTEKAYTLKNRVYAFVDSAARARELDELLWTYRAGSFVPHEIESGADAGPVPVVIGHDPATQPDGDLLINLSATTPSFFDRFGRVAEIVDGSDDGKRAGRERFAFYRDNGFAPNTHKIA